MEGGAGNDTYFVDNAGDLVIENANEGNDTVFSTVDHRLSANVEYLVLQGSAVQGDGNGLNNAIIRQSATTISSMATPAPTRCSAAQATTSTSSMMPPMRRSRTPTRATTRSTPQHYRLSANLESLVMQGGAVQGYGNHSSNAIYGRREQSPGWERRRRLHAGRSRQRPLFPGQCRRPGRRERQRRHRHGLFLDRKLPTFRQCRISGAAR